MWTSSSQSERRSGPSSNRGTVRSFTAVANEESEEANKRQRSAVSSIQTPHGAPSLCFTSESGRALITGDTVTVPPQEMTRDASIQVLRSLRAPAAASTVPVARLGTRSLSTLAESNTNNTLNWLQYAHQVNQGPMSNEAAVLQFLERQQLFAQLSAASSTTPTLSNGAFTPQPLAHLLIPQQMPSPLVNQYLMMHNLQSLAQPMPPQALINPFSAMMYHPNNHLRHTRFDLAPTPTSIPSELPAPLNDVARVGSGGASLRAVPENQPTMLLANVAAGAHEPEHEHELKPSASSTHVAASAGSTQNEDVPLCLPVLLYRPSDHEKLSKLQTLLRQQIQVFQATEQDTSTHIRGRNKSIKVGQVGIRCRHCVNVPIATRCKGSMYFPTSVWGFYQASQNMLGMHLQPDGCFAVPPLIRAQIVDLLSGKHATSASGAGRPYWATTALQLGLVDTLDGIYFVRDLPPDARFPVPNEDGTPGVYRKANKSTGK